MVLLPLVLVLLAFYVIKFLRGKWKLHQIKIPNLNKFPWFIEIFYPIVRLGISSAETRFKIMGQYSLEFPDMMKLWLGPKLVIFVNSPDRIQKVLMAQSCLEKWQLFYRLTDRGNGLVSASVKNKWKEHRKFFNFSFSLKILESFLPTFSKYSEELCNQLIDEQSNGEEFNFFEYTKKTAFDISSATTLGTDIRTSMSSENYEKLFDAFEV